jgi:alpha/beta superfamily hydrolase
VLENRLIKLKAARAGGNFNFQQLEIEAANHFFDDKNEELIEAINGWLKALP